MLWHQQKNALQHQWIDANRYIAHFQSALRPGYTYDNPALQLFVTWPPNVRPRLPYASEFARIDSKNWSGALERHRFRGTSVARRSTPLRRS